jgi:hypothetical protein
MYEICIGKDRMKISKFQLGVLTEKAQKMVRKVHRQGGRIHLSAGSIKPEFRPA